MPTRRQEKVARIIRDTVSDAIANHLSDPRIQGYVSVTRVSVAADMQIADVYLSVFGADAAQQKLTFEAIDHARGRIQSFIGKAVSGKFCPTLRLHPDEAFKKTLETMKLIDRISEELRAKRAPDESEDKE